MSVAQPLRLAEAEQLLARHFGHARLRPLQRRVIHSVLAERDTLAVLPTGGGKSACFQLPALLLPHPVVVVSPLIALMQDQVAAAVARGLPAGALHSALSADQQEEVLGGVTSGRLRLLYASPERLQGLARTLPRPIALLAVDEAHCISEWGHDFRPAYRRLTRVRYHLGWPPTLALTGSATPGVQADIVGQLGLGRRDRRLVPVIGSFDRPNLRFAVRPVADETQRWQALRDLLETRDRIALVYVQTRNAAAGLARRLREAGFLSACYHAGMPDGARRAVLAQFLADRLEVVVATSAFGMGIDQPRVRLVVHWRLPGSLEAYYQEAGRAGRDGAAADCVLLYRPGDDAIPRRQMEATLPPDQLLRTMWAGRAPPGTPGPVREAAQRLAREFGDGGHAAVDWGGLARRRRAARVRLEAMTRYAARRQCRRRALLGYFGERLRRCTGCDVCAPASADRAPLPPADSRPADREPLARLCRWRQQAARDRAVPLAAIASDELLRALARAAPADRGALAAVAGVGPRFLAKYGAAVLAVCGAGQEP